VVDKVLLAEPRGFCAGVEMAIKSLAMMTRLFEPPIYCYHEIVHNKLVVEAFERAGVIFVEDVAEVPPGAPLMLSAHGSAPAVEAAAGEQGRVVVNAVCPLVTKVHHELKMRARQGYTIAYVGHAGHEEAAGTMAVAPDAVCLIEELSDLDRLPPPSTPIALLAQTTLSHDDWSDIAAAVSARYPDAWLPAKSDLCYATTNRQAALRVIAARCDSVIVIGSANSSNTRSLEKVARGFGCSPVVRVDRAEEVPLGLSGTVGVTAGASAPESLVELVIERLAPRDGVEIVQASQETEYFPPPRELRELTRALAAAVALGAAAPVVGASPVELDRLEQASTTLAGLLRAH
jgi:4-hydroxy-3-methylbut-2-enyl diphosphate reductase